MASLIQTWLLYSLILPILVYTLYRLYPSIFQTQPRLPPGLKPWPVVGNIGDLPPSGSLEWLRHKDLYGPISSVTVLGTTIILIHDKQMAHDLLTKNGRRTAGRPEMVMANTLCGYGRVTLCQSYTSPTFKRDRRLLHQEVGTKSSAAQFRGIQEAEVARQLVRILRDPERLDEHYETTAAAMILRVTYGYTTEPQRPDPLVALMKQTLADFSRAAAPGAWAVDLLPMLRYLPEGLPGTGFKTLARKWRRNVHASVDVPYSFARSQEEQQLLGGDGQEPCYVSKLVEKLSSENRDGGGQLNLENEKAIMWTATGLFGAATDTTAMSMRAFKLAMIRFPQVQRRAQEEIDRVVGRDRLPTFEDMEQLPYVCAVVRETLRWWPAALLGFPHTATEAFEYAKHDIPKGAVMLPSVYWFMRDPAVYKDPEAFGPSRFLEPRCEADPRTEVFGFGLRLCPGRFFGEASLSLNIAQTLAVLHLSRAVDVDGVEVGVQALEHVKPQAGVLAYPTKFECRGTPRSDRCVELIRDLENRFPFEAGDAHKLSGCEKSQAGSRFDKWAQARMCT
ncbi:O-methylsterigmatocystin oxidoreductase [Microdochium bolleyi]|uniref:O-methylsterigmatocystin oxidoreductase n=1 Tax=Microdochium bolleyi TaxID=196109 RepID=A0A136IR87_9PEZI|nr:O-methylsterigmatocystin oxidoreductase [Microdochium bolleyi]